VLSTMLTEVREIRGLRLKLRCSTPKRLSEPTHYIETYWSSSCSSRQRREITTSERRPGEAREDDASGSGCGERVSTTLDGV